MPGKLSAMLAPFSIIFAFALAPCVAVEPDNEAEVRAEFSVARAGDLLIVPVTIGGKSYPFLVQTGATFTTFGKPLEDHVREEVRDDPLWGFDSDVPTRYVPTRPFSDTFPCTSITACGCMISMIPSAFSSSVMTEYCGWMHLSISS